MDGVNYWQIELWSKEKIDVKPENVQYVQKALQKGDGFIITATRSINIKDIKDFSESDKPYRDQKLIEDSAIAFREPLYEGNSVKGRYMKIHISKRAWDREKSHIPGYRLLENQDNYVSAAILVPIHQINRDTMFDLTPDEELRLARLQ